jgi:hypothetical protein
MSAPTVLILGEDTAHGVLAGCLLHGLVASGAWTHRGDRDLSGVLPDLRYNQHGDVDTSRVKTRGHILGESLRPGAAFARKVITSALLTKPTVLIFVKDTDGRDGFVDGIQQVVPLFSGHSTPVIFALPHRDAEAWFVAGFVPGSREEHERVAVLRRTLSFDPLTQPERLTAHPNDAPQDAKRVLRTLLGLDPESRPLALDELERDRHHERLFGDLDRLRRVGAHCGLVAFLDDLESRAARVLATSSAP